MFALSKTCIAALIARARVTVLYTVLATVLGAAHFSSAAQAADEKAASPAAMAAEQIASRLKAAYPGLIKDVEGNGVFFADGTRLPLDDGKPNKNFSDWLEAPDIEDMFRMPYIPGEAGRTPAAEEDPGRARNGSFFSKIYGDCRSGGVKPELIDVAWLPKKSREKVSFSKINGAAARLAAVSAELDNLPEKFDVYLRPTAGTYNCRLVAGTKNMSAHSYGIAIDIALKHAHYWRWTKTAGGGAIAYKNEIPFEIVRIFEKHGFIWGGKWYHYDTMHFEYRPELLAPEALPSKESGGP